MVLLLCLLACLSRLRLESNHLIGLSGLQLKPGLVASEVEPTS